MRILAFSSTTVMSYSLLKHIHLTTVLVTLALFVLRGYWMLNAPHHLEQRWVRILPHTNDTILLAAAIGMLVVGGLNPIEHPWLIAKILGLLAYIGLGTLALKRGRTRAIRIEAFIAALGVFGYIVAVAITKEVVPGF